MHFLMSFSLPESSSPSSDEVLFLILIQNLLHSYTGLNENRFNSLNRQVTKRCVSYCFCNMELILLAVIKSTLAILCMWGKEDYIHYYWKWVRFWRHNKILILYLNILVCIQTKYRNIEVTENLVIAGIIIYFLCT